MTLISERPYGPDLCELKRLLHMPYCYHERRFTRKTTVTWVAYPIREASIYDAVGSPRTASKELFRAPITHRYTFWARPAIAGYGHMSDPMVAMSYCETCESDSRDGSRPAGQEARREAMHIEVILDPDTRRLASAKSHEYLPLHIPGMGTGNFELVLRASYLERFAKRTHKTTYRSAIFEHSPVVIHGTLIYSGVENRGVATFVVRLDESGGYSVVKSDGSQDSQSEAPTFTGTDHAKAMLQAVVSGTSLKVATTDLDDIDSTSLEGIIDDTVLYGFNYRRMYEHFAFAYPHIVSTWFHNSNLTNVEHAMIERASKRPSLPMKSFNWTGTIGAEMREALKLQYGGSATGMDWEKSIDGAARLLDEAREFMEEVMAAGDIPWNASPSSNMISEMGDVLFMAISMCRHAGIDPSEALSRTNQKVRYRQAVCRMYFLHRDIAESEVTRELAQEAWAVAKFMEKRAYMDRYTPATSSELREMGYTGPLFDDPQ